MSADTISLPLLDRVKIASPCHVRWDDMTGDERVRHCASCNLNVHNFSAMTRAESEALLAQHFNHDGSAKNGRFCGGMYKRADGTIIFADCPVGVARLVAASRKAAARVAAAVGLISLAGWLTSKAAAYDYSLTQYEPFASLTKVMTYAGVLRPQPIYRFDGDMMITRTPSTPVAAEPIDR